MHFDVIPTPKNKKFPTPRPLNKPRQRKKSLFRTYLDRDQNSPLSEPSTLGTRKTAANLLPPRRFVAAGNGNFNKNKQWNKEPLCLRESVASRCRVQMVCERSEREYPWACVCT
jgi:hypothetical protein